MPATGHVPPHSECLDFDTLRALWAAAQHGEATARVALADALAVAPESVAQALRAAAGFADPSPFAFVATTRALARTAGDDDVVERIRVAHDAVLRTLQIAGVDDAFQKVARELLAERPRLESLHGRARLLEELRRDILREPRLPLPDGLDELVREATPTTGSPPIRGLEESV